MFGFMLNPDADALAASGMAHMAQAQPAPAPSPPAAPAANPPAHAEAQTAAAEPIGNVASLTGSASVTRNSATTKLELRDDIFAGDVVETGAKSALGITFADATTFNLTANAKITIDHYLYEEGGQQNGALFDVAKGTLAFVAASVAKTGDMRIATPTALLSVFAAPLGSSRCRKAPPPRRTMSRSSFIRTRTAGSDGSRSMIAAAPSWAR